LIARREEGTGQWFLESPEFADWLHVPRSTLFCPGIPGAGKSMLAAIAIEHLLETQASDSVGVAFIYCNYKTQTEASTSTLLAALLKQLVQSRPVVDDSISKLHEQHNSRSTKPSFQEIFVALQAVLKNFSRVYFIIDALDECSNQNGTRNQLLAKIRDLQRETDLRLISTSRFLPDIEINFASTPTLEIRASSPDVRQFVRGQIHRLPSCIRRDYQLQNLVEDKVIEAVDGM
jgi:Cdc6-like AAA superfamily ATPase